MQTSPNTAHLPFIETDTKNLDRRSDERDSLLDPEPLRAGTADYWSPVRKATGQNGELTESQSRTWHTSWILHQVGGVKEGEVHAKVCLTKQTGAPDHISSEVFEAPAKLIPENERLFKLHMSTQLGPSNWEDVIQEARGRAGEVVIKWLFSKERQDA